MPLTRIYTQVFQKAHIFSMLSFALCIHAYIHIHRYIQRHKCTLQNVALIGVISCSLLQLDAPDEDSGFLKPGMYVCIYSLLAICVHVAHLFMYLNTHFMYLCIYMCVYIYIYMHMHMIIIYALNMYTFMFACMLVGHMCIFNTSIHVFKHTLYVFMHRYVYIYTYMHIYIYICIYIYLYTHMHVIIIYALHMYTFMFACM
jgi:hypothetical protein